MTKLFYLSLVFSICLFSCNRLKHDNKIDEIATHDFEVGEILYSAGDINTIVYEEPNNKSTVIFNLNSTFYEGVVITEITNHYEDKNVWLKVKSFDLKNEEVSVKQGYVLSNELIESIKIHTVENIIHNSVFLDTAKLSTIKFYDNFNKYEFYDNKYKVSFDGKYKKTYKQQILLIGDEYDDTLLNLNSNYTLTLEGETSESSNTFIPIRITDEMYWKMFYYDEKIKKRTSSGDSKIKDKQLTKNGKKLLKVSALRGLYLGGDWYDLKDQLGTPDEEYRLGTSLYSSYVYYRSALDDYYNEPQHITIMISPQGIVQEVWFCKPGNKLQISRIESISTPK
jgi:hypothetical protein